MVPGHRTGLGALGKKKAFRLALLDSQPFREKKYISEGRKELPDKRLAFRARP
jgi:hypothetical protein